MTLTRLLEINSRLIEPPELASVGLAERIWRECGRPTGARELTDLLEKVLSECEQTGIRYAPILLQRKKALHRGTWAPQIPVVSIGKPSKEGDASDGGCAYCGGTGYAFVNGGRSATLCACEGWRKRSNADQRELSSTRAVPKRQVQ
jgi:hypothetical protein